MNLGRKIGHTSVALGVVLALGVAVTAVREPHRAQRRGRVYTPAKDAKDLRAVLLDVANQGMLKGTDERDMVATLNIRARAPSGRAGMYADEVPREHQLPDLESADSVHLHASQRTRRSSTSKS